MMTNRDIIGIILITLCLIWVFIGLNTNQF